MFDSTFNLNLGPVFRPQQVLGDVALGIADELIPTAEDFLSGLEGAGAGDAGAVTDPALDVPQLGTSATDSALAEVQPTPDLNYQNLESVSAPDYQGAVTPSLSYEAPALETASESGPVLETISSSPLAESPLMAVSPLMEISAPTAAESSLLELSGPQAGESSLNTFIPKEGDATAVDQVCGL